MQGVYIAGRRPKSKKAIREALKTEPHKVTLERTAFMGNEYGGPVLDMPENVRQTFVGPDPYTSRKFYGSMLRSGTTIKLA